MTGKGGKHCCPAFTLSDELLKNVRKASERVSYPEIFIARRLYCMLENCTNDSRRGCGMIGSKNVAEI